VKKEKGKKTRASLSLSLFPFSLPVITLTVHGRQQPSPGHVVVERPLVEEADAAGVAEVGLVRRAASPGGGVSPEICVRVLRRKRVSELAIEQLFALFPRTRQRERGSGMPGEVDR